MGNCRGCPLGSAGGICHRLGLLALRVRGGRRLVTRLLAGGHFLRTQSESNLAVCHVAALAGTYRQISRRQKSAEGDRAAKAVLRNGLPLGIIGYAAAGHGPLGLLGASLICGAILSYHLTGPVVVARDTEFLLTTPLSGAEVRAASLYYLTTESAALASLLLVGALVATHGSNPLLALGVYGASVLATAAIGMLGLRFRQLRRSMLGFVLGIVVAGGQFGPQLLHLAHRVGATAGTSGVVVLDGAFVGALILALILGMSGGGLLYENRHERVLRTKIPQPKWSRATVGTATARTEEKLGLQGVLVYVAILLFELVFLLRPLYQSSRAAPGGSPVGVAHPAVGLLLATVVVVSLGQFIITRRTVPGLMQDPERGEWILLRTTPMSATSIALSFSLPGIGWTGCFSLAATAAMGATGVERAPAALLFSLGIMLCTGLAAPMVVMAALGSRWLGNSLILGPALARIGVMLIMASVGASVLLGFGSASILALIALMFGNLAIGAIGLAGSGWLIRREFRTLT